MNQRDRENLNFLLTISPDTFDEWVSQADDDDIMYALELIKRARLELTMRQFEAIDEIRDVDSMLKAKEIIEKIKNKR